MIDRRGFFASLADALNGLVGQLLWQPIAGPSTGGALTVELGRAVQRPVAPHPHPRLNPPSHQGESSLYIRCAWRVDNEDEVLTSSLDDNSLDGPMLRALRVLDRTTITAVSLRWPSCDLVLTLSGGVRLSIFCDQVDESDDDGDNYNLVLPGRAYIIGAKSIITVELRGGNTS
jgi:hypothetical protein